MPPAASLIELGQRGELGSTKGGMTRFGRGVGEDGEWLYKAGRGCKGRRLEFRGRRRGKEEGRTGSGARWGQPQSSGLGPHRANMAGFQHSRSSPPFCGAEVSDSVEMKPSLTEQWGLLALEPN